MLFFKRQISRNKKSGGKKYSAGSNFCFIGLKIMKFYSNLYFIILKKLCMANMRFFYFFHFCGMKKGFLALPPDAEVFQKEKKKPEVLNFFVANIVLILLFSYVKRYFDKSLWKKMPFVIKLSPPLENP